MYRKLTRPSRLSSEMAAQIRALIRDKRLRPDDKLPSETHLAELFGVSRPTVREAVKSLVSQNVISIARGRGTYVSRDPGFAADPLGLDFLGRGDLPHSLAEVRGIIEPGVARLAAERAGPEDVAALERLVGRMAEVASTGEAWIDLEVDFHRGVARATSNPVIMRIVPVVLEAIVKSLELSPRTPEDHRQALKEHSGILAAIREHNPDRAYLVMDEHLKASQRRTVAISMRRRRASKARSPAERQPRPRRKPG